MGVELGGGRAILKGKGVLCNSSDHVADDEGSPAEETSRAVNKIRTAAGTTMLIPFKLLLEMIFISFFYSE
jgi:hypothetical protein